MTTGLLLRAELATADAHGEVLRVELESDSANSSELLRVELATGAFILLDGGPDRIVDGMDLVTIDMAWEGTTPTSWVWSVTNPAVVLAKNGPQATFIAPASLSEIAFDVIATATAVGVSSSAEAVRVTVLPHNEWSLVAGQWVPSGEDEEVVL